MERKGWNIIAPLSKSQPPRQGTTTDVETWRHVHFTDLSDIFLEEVECMKGKRCLSETILLCTSCIITEHADCQDNRLLDSERLLPRMIPFAHGPLSLRKWFTSPPSLPFLSFPLLPILIPLHFTASSLHTLPALHCRHLTQISVSLMAKAD